MNAPRFQFATVAKRIESNTATSMDWKKWGDDFQRALSDFISVTDAHVKRFDQSAQMPDYVDALLEFQLQTYQAAADGLLFLVAGLAQLKALESALAATLARLQKTGTGES